MNFGCHTVRGLESDAERRDACRLVIGQDIEYSKRQTWEEIKRDVRNPKPVFPTPKQDPE
jgi:hypothetical protein